MSDNVPGSTPSTGTVSGVPTLLWPAAVAVAGLGSWILYDALPGINWVLWTGAAVAGLGLCARSRGSALMAGAPIAIAGGAAVTASPRLSALICLAVAFFLAVQMLLSAGLTLQSITARLAATAPLLALRLAVTQAMRRSLEATQLIRSTRARGWVRGLAITLPVLVGFALLLAAVDPLFAEWRDLVGNLIDWAFVPRVVFFLVLLVIVLGAYGYASLPAGGSPFPEVRNPAPWLGSTERFILLAGVAALFWLFLALQLGYFFGNVPRIPASGMTFAEYARRGFAELSIVASASVLLIVGSERYGKDDGHQRPLRLLTGAVIAAVLLLLGSAFRRVWLYEMAYGFTTARLYAQCYMGAVALGLAVLALEIVGDFDPGRLFRRAAGGATILFIALIYWNHEGWIARQNLDRFATTGQLDIAYLARGLSPDAIPAIAQRLPSLPEPTRSDLRRALRDHYAGDRQERRRAWFEWNLASSRARRALDAIFDSP
jgi:Domain of unknown function (DUF4153)